MACDGWVNPALPSCSLTSQNRVGLLHCPPKTPLVESAARASPISCLLVGRSDHPSRWRRARPAPGCSVLRRHVPAPRSAFRHSGANLVTRCDHIAAPHRPSPRAGRGVAALARGNLGSPVPRVRGAVPRRGELALVPWHHHPQYHAGAADRMAGRAVPAPPPGWSPYSPRRWSPGVFPEHCVEQPVPPVHCLRTTGPASHGRV